MNNRCTEWKSFKNVSKTKKKKKHMKRISFITQFKIELLLLFICCRKMFGKIPAADVKANKINKK